jgi:amino acid adenylation domain-containing protein
MNDTLDTSREELITILLKKKRLALAKGRTSANDVPVALPRDRAFPLSYVQERLWILQQRDKNNTYNMSGGVTLEGPLSLIALERALEALIQRHEPLRTRFVMASGELEPHQRIEPAMQAALLVREVREEQITQFVSEHCRQIFDLDRGALFNVLLLRLAPDRHVLSLVLHHIVADGWSIDVIVRDMQALYAAQLARQPSELPPLAIQYADYAVWQRGRDLSQHLAYWTSNLGGYPGPFDLTPDMPQRQGRPGRADSVTRALPRGLAAALGKFSSERKASLFMLLLTGVALTIYRQTRQSDLCIGTTVAGREQLVLEPLVGFFINILPLRFNLSGELTGEELLAQVKQVVFDGMAHQALPFEHLLTALPEMRQQDGAALLPVMVRHQNFPQAEVEHWAGGLQARALPEIAEQLRTAKCDLDLQYFGDASGLSVVAEFDVDRFDRQSVEALLLQTEDFLRELVKRPQAPLHSLIAPSAEEKAKLKQWNETARTFEQTSVTELFARQVLRTPEAVACVDGERTLIYEQLDRRSDNLARVLKELGVGPEVRVALYLRRSAEFLTGLLAVFKARGVYVPVDPAYPEAYVERIVEDAQPAVILVESGFRPNLAHASAQIVPIEERLLAGEWKRLEQGIGAEAGDLAYIAYTSGTTGEPKGVCVEHGQLLNCLQALWAEIPFEADEVVVQKTATTFVVSVKELLAGLLVGVRQVIAPDLLIRDTPAFAELLERQGVTRLNLVPSHLAGLLEQAKRLKRLRHVVTAGEPLSQRLRERFESLLPGVRLYNNYGCTELNDVSYCVPGEQGSAGAMVPMGRPIANVRLHVLDEQQRVLPVGVAGELYVEGAAVGRRGYWNQPEWNRDRFVANPLEAGGPLLFRTGDQVRRLGDGRLEYLGRNDFQVKIRGQRIDVGQVEQVLAEHPGVVSCAVMGHGSGTEQASLVAYYVCGPEAELTHNQLYGWLRDRLPGYMVPAAYVRIEKLPVLPNGKLDRRALPAPDAGSYSGQGYEEPQGEIEQRIAAIWAEVLKLPLKRIGRHDNFFAMGGQSMTAVQVMERMRQAGLYADIAVLFGQATPAALADAMESGKVVHAPPNGIPFAGCNAITPNMLPLVDLTALEIELIASRVPGGAANIQDIYPLAPLQEGALFHHLASGDGDPYLLNTMLALESREKLNSFLSALQAVVDRHDILRTAVLWEGLREPLQVVLRSALMAVEEISFPLAASDVSELLQERFDSRRYRLDLTKAPLLQAYIARDEPHQRWILLLLFHHLVMDRTALNIVQEEVLAHLRGEAANLPAARPYRNFVAQARMGSSREEQEAFFREMLSDVDEPTLPFGIASFSGDAADSNDAAQLVDDRLAKRLRDQARTLGISVASLFHLAWARVLAKTSGRDDVVFGTVLLGRMQGGAGADRALGMFINTLPFRVRLGGESVRATLRQTHDLLSALLVHEHASLSMAQRCSAVPAPTPLFFALLNYRHRAEVANSETDFYRRYSGIDFISAQDGGSYPIRLSVEDFNEGFQLRVQVAGDIEAARMCGYVHRALEKLAEALERNPEAPMLGLDVLPPAERQRVLHEWNETGADYRDAPLHKLFEEQVERTPEARAVMYEGAGLTYAELNRRANRLAHYLRELGVKPDERVAICLERGLEMMVGILAVLKAGGVYVPLDPAQPVERLHFLLRDCAPVVLLTERGLRGMLDAEVGGSPVVELDGQELEWKNASEENVAVETVGLTPGHLAYVIYTSGSTGAPKGVCIEHRSLSNYLQWSDHTYYRESGYGSPAVHSIGFDGLVTTLFGPLLAGQCLQLLKRGEGAEGVAAGVGEKPYTLVKVTPSHLKLVNQVLRASGKTASPTKALMIGGEALVPADIAFWQERFPEVRLINHFGPTEITVGCATFEIKQDVAGSQNIPIGKPIWNTQIYILDKQGEPAPVGVTGELYVGGAGVARGYLNRPELTAERFVRDRFSQKSGARMYKTGDLGRWLADGNIEFLGRNDDQVKIRGFRIELGEIEARLAEQAGVREAVVLAREDTPGDKRLVAYYTSEDQVFVSVEQLREQLSARLPGYMVPAAYVRLESLPLTPNGKLNRRALPVPEADDYSQQEYEAPQGEIEHTIAGIWADVLELPFERIGRHHNFFALGGQSMLAVRVAERMRQAGLTADIRTLFSNGTLAHLGTMAALPVANVPVPPNPIPEQCEAITPEMLPLVQLTAQEIEHVVNRVPGGVGNVQDIYPLAPMQEGILFHHLMSEEGDPYVGGMLLSFDNRAILENYKNILQAVIDRHDILRTAIAWEDLPEPVQVVWRKAVLPIQEVELNADQGEAAEQLQVRFDPRCYRIDVRQAPLVHARIAADPKKKRWLMMLLFHHLTSDHTTLEVILDEVLAHLNGTASRLPAPLPFRNLVAEARRITQQEHESFFREMLGDVEEPTAPFGLVDMQDNSTALREERISLDESLAKRLRDSARRLKVSPAALFHLAWAQTLAKVSGRDDVVFGTVLFGRMQGGEGAHRIVGPFINTLPIRFHLGETAVAESVQRAQVLLADLLRHEHASLTLAQRCSRVSAPTPLFSTLLNYRHTSARDLPSSGADTQAGHGIEILGIDERTNYPLILSIDDLREGFRLTAQSSIDPERICALVCTVLTSLVEALENSPATPVRALKVLSASERDQVLTAWNETAHQVSAATVTGLFEEQVARTPRAIAVLSEDASLTYAELNRRANQLAHYLRGLGVQPDTRVGICLERNLQMAVAVLAVLKAGGAYVPLDPEYPAERLRYMLEDSTPVVVLTQARVAKSVGIDFGEIPVLMPDGVDSAWNQAETKNLDPVETGLKAEHLTYVIYTSGSTGRPKGVELPHRALVNLLEWHQGALLSGAKTLQFAPLSFDVSFYELFTTWSSGGTLYFASEEIRKDPALLIQFLDRTGIEKAILPVIVLQQIATLDQRETGLPALREIITTGEQLTVTESIRQWFRQRPHCRLMNHYGPSETHVVTAYEFAGVPEQWSTRAPIGKPIWNTQIYILDGQGEPTPVGVAGELYIGGAGVARGYLNRVELTAQRFVQDRFSHEAGARMYKTGDLGRWLPDGNLEFLGRNDDQVKIRGFRIELGEIEARLAEQPGVREAAVLVREDTVGDKRLVAYYTSEDQASVSVEQLREQLSARLPGYMVPAAYVRLESLPLTPSGKLNRRALPAPETDAYSQQEYEEPRGETERAIAAIWAEVLELPLERIGRHDNFFSLGGQSLRAVRVVTRLRHHFAVEFPLRSVFERPSIASVAEQVSIHLEKMPKRQLVEQEVRSAVAGLSYEQLQSLLAQKRKSNER